MSDDSSRVRQRILQLLDPGRETRELFKVEDGNIKLNLARFLTSKARRSIKLTHTLGTKKEA